MNPCVCPEIRLAGEGRFTLVDKELRGGLIQIDPKRIQPGQTQVFFIVSLPVPFFSHNLHRPAFRPIAKFQHRTKIKGDGLAAQALGGQLQTGRSAVDHSGAGTLDPRFLPTQLRQCPSGHLAKRAAADKHFL